MKQIIFEVDDLMEKSLQKLRQLSESIDDVKLMHKALALYQFLLKRSAQGHRVYIKDDSDNITEVEVK